MNGFLMTPFPRSIVNVTTTPAPTIIPAKTKPSLLSIMYQKSIRLSNIKFLRIA